MKETELAKTLINCFEGKGYECYKEVSSSGDGGSKRADCYFVKKENGIIIDSFSVETKTTLNLTVIEQAFLWKSLSKRVYIGVPKLKKKPVKGRKTIKLICSKLGIGIIEISKDNIEIIQEAEVNLNFKFPPLYEEQKKSEAGNSNSQYFTRYKKTIDNLDLFMNDKKECSLKEIISKIEHHYSNNLSAQGSISSYIKKGILKKYRLKKNKREVFVEKI